MGWPLAPAQHLRRWGEGRLSRLKEKLAASGLLIGGGILLLRSPARLRPLCWFLLASCPSLPL